jgi:hypothetical protein
VPEKTDKVHVKNGDVITCEVEKLEYGYLTVKTDPMSTVTIKWRQVLRVTSKERFTFDFADGSRLSGSLAEASASGKLRIVTSPEGDYQEHDLLDVIFLFELEEKRSERIDGDFSLGYTFTKASEVSQLNFTFDISGTTETYMWEGNLSSIDTAQPGEDNSNRSQGQVAYWRYFERRWFGLVQVLGEHNDELGLDLRANVAVLGGRTLAPTRAMVVAAGLGLNANREWNSDDTEANNLEGIAALRYEWFIRDSPKLDLSTRVSLYPSLTTAGRVRGSASVSVRKEFVKDLFWKLQAYGDYDSDPPLDGATGDYGLVASIEYSW